MEPSIAVVVNDDLIPAISHRRRLAMALCSFDDLQTGYLANISCQNRVICNHVIGCEWKYCNFIRCKEYKLALSHAKSCRDKFCAICSPFRLQNTRRRLFLLEERLTENS